jgi:hypothetical protein
MNEETKEKVIVLITQLRKYMDRIFINKPCLKETCLYRIIAL